MGVARCGASLPHTAQPAPLLLLERMVDQPRSNWALDFVYPLARERTRIVYKVSLLEKPTFTLATRKWQFLTPNEHRFFDEIPLPYGPAALCGFPLIAGRSEASKRYCWGTVGRLDLIEETEGR